MNMWEDEQAAIKTAALMKLPKLKEKENMEQTNEAIIGSHNSMSYLRPANWWGWLLLPFARCQSKAVEGQFVRHA